MKTFRYYFSDRTPALPQDEYTTVPICYAGVHIPDNDEEAARDRKVFTSILQGTIYGGN